jgi:uncharacterized protein YwqG
MFTSVRNLEASLLSGGLSAAGACFVAERARPGVILQTQGDASEDEIPLGATKIGGRPDLPAGSAWPVRPPYPDAAERVQLYRDYAAEGLPDLSLLDQTPELLQYLPADGSFSEIGERLRETFLAKAETEAATVTREAPLAFIAQIDLAAVAAASVSDLDLPRAGRWLLFYDVATQPGGYQPSDAVGTRLIFDSTPTDALVRREPPDEVAGHRFEALRCDLAASLVPFANHAFEANDRLDENDYSALSAWAERQNLMGRHRVGGYPEQIQGDMAEECVLASDDNNDMMWGDSGMLYLWIRRDALRERRFEEARLIAQCY